MADIIRYRKEFLPHIIRLFCPGSEKVDGHLCYFQQLLSMYRPDPEDSCLLLKDKHRLLACAYMVSLEAIQRNLIYVNLAMDSELSEKDCEEFWVRCHDLARTLVPDSPILRITVGGNPTLPGISNFKEVREYVELNATLGQLPVAQEGADDFQVVSLADQPQLEEQWLEAFNQGLTVFWDMPLLDSAAFSRLRNLPGYDGAAFRLGLEEGEPVTALFYSVLDSNQGLVRINAAASPSGTRGRGFGRRMLKDTLSHLEQQGLKAAILYTESSNQATSLLYKMMGFVPQGKTKIMELQL